MTRLPLNTLVAFRTVAELQNLRAAADALHLTHSAVSQQIRVLEERLGFALFERRGRRCAKCPGEALLPACRPRWRNSTTACRRLPRRPPGTHRGCA